ncbi:Plastid lipid-associated protein/fibrillin conserved domain containing protein [Parasponia andersonii]|uniref:Plastid lipid-associated protein/fibrillin conserved domain containing protein n=1 Tax=Parasponia andersonii TaxID=3476 RepID=A0A2P5AME1_PARAD|nr:Plastid lipid-associated protein/fibrillin conserved domain containing protein [Parasponia andersonii]
MASSSQSFLPHSPSLTSLSHSSPSSSSSSSSSTIKSLIIQSSPTTTHYPIRRRLLGRRRSFSLRSVQDEVSAYVDPPPPPPPPEDERSPSFELLPYLKLKLLSAVSGVNRGLAANEEDLRKAEDAAKELEGVAGKVDLSKDLDKLQGRWKLIYSSAFSSRTLGGSRPGPPTGRLLPITLGQVFQRIDILSKDFDNIVDLEFGAPWPFPPIEVTATLAYKFELIGTSSIKITFEKTTVKATGNLSQLPPLDLPRLPDGLRPQSNPGSGEFEVTYLDDDTRITRGDRGELRVFVIS